MYKTLALLNGMLIAVMVLSNGLMMEVFDNTPSVVLNHLTGLLVILSIFMLSREKWKPLKGIHLFYLLGGLTGLFTVYFTNLSFILLGATLTLMLSMVGRIITSITIDHFGLMGMKPYPFHPSKLIGLAFMICGVVFIILS